MEIKTMHHAGGACFDFVATLDGYPVIHDLNGRCSITNAAEDVVFAVIEVVSRARAAAIAAGLTVSRFHPRAIIYRDSAGMFDAMLVRRGEFEDFVVLNGSSAAEAIERLPPARTIR